MRSSNINEDADHWSDSLDRLLLSLPSSLTHIPNWCLVEQSAPFRSRVSRLSKQSGQARNRSAHLICFPSYIPGRNWAGKMLVFKYMLTYWSPLLHFMWKNKLTTLRRLQGPFITGSDVSQQTFTPSFSFLWPSSSSLRAFHAYGGDKSKIMKGKEEKPGEQWGYRSTALRDPWPKPAPREHPPPHQELRLRAPELCPGRQDRSPRPQL